jgi:hypothetical protein
MLWINGSLVICLPKRLSLKNSRFLHNKILQFCAVVYFLRNDLDSVGSVARLIDLKIEADLARVLDVESVRGRFDRRPIARAPLVLSLS